MGTSFDTGLLAKWQLGHVWHQGLDVSGCSSLCKDTETGELKTVLCTFD